MRPEIEFKEFNKIYRLNREVIVTEKIDGTNGCIYIGDDGKLTGVGSRTRWITPEDDNFGFARWAWEHREDLEQLGPGTHYGEWWGYGVQRDYGLKEKRFSLFNVGRWSDEAFLERLALDAGTPKRPMCCHVVPEVGRIVSLNDGMLGSLLAKLTLGGSLAAPGFMKPEGIVLFHVPSQFLFKVTIEKDAERKGKGK